MLNTKFNYGYWLTGIEASILSGVENIGVWKGSLHRAPLYIYIRRRISSTFASLDVSPQFGALKTLKCC